MPTNRKGDRRERELVNLLAGKDEDSPFDEDEWAVMRAPGSGSATERELPDVLAGNGTDFYAIEAKSSNGDPIYLDGEEVQALMFFARNFGAKPRIGARFDRMDWRFFHPLDLHQTRGGNVRVKQSLVDDGRGQPLSGLDTGHYHEDVASDVDAELRELEADLGLDPI